MRALHHVGIQHPGWTLGAAAIVVLALAPGLGRLQARTWLALSSVPANGRLGVLLVLCIAVATLILLPALPARPGGRA